MEMTQAVALCVMCAALTAVCVCELVQAARQYRHAKRRAAQKRRMQVIAQKQKTIQTKREHARERYYLQNFWEYDGHEQREFEEIE